MFINSDYGEGSLSNSPKEDKPNLASRIDFRKMSERLRYIAWGILLQQRYHEVIQHSPHQPGFLKTKLFAALVKEMKDHDAKLIHVERDGIEAFRDFCLHPNQRGSCPVPDCETYLFPTNFFRFYTWWVERHPEDEDQLMALWDKFGIRSLGQMPRKEPWFDNVFPIKPANKEDGGNISPDDIDLGV